MTIDLAEYSIHVVRLPTSPPHRLQLYASVFRQLRLQALRESPQSFTETHDEVRARPELYWEDFLKDRVGLIQLAFGLPGAMATKIPTSNEAIVEDWIATRATPLAMVVHTGPVPQDRFICPVGSWNSENKPDWQEMRFHGGMLYLVPDIRGSAARGTLYEALTLDRDNWLLNKLKSTDSNPPPVARYRAHIKPGKNQRGLLGFYVGAGWYIAGLQTWRTNLLAEGGVESVRVAEDRGDSMEEVAVIVERTLTVAHLEWSIAENKRLLEADAPPQKEGPKL